jgi:hypothetical protein
VVAKSASGPGEHAVQVGQPTSSLRRSYPMDESPSYQYVVHPRSWLERIPGRQRIRPDHVDELRHRGRPALCPRLFLAADSPRMRNTARLLPVPSTATSDSRASCMVRPRRNKRAGRFDTDRASGCCKLRRRRPRRRSFRKSCRDNRAGGWRVADGRRVPQHIARWLRKPLTIHTLGTSQWSRALTARTGKDDFARSRLRSSQ